MAVMFKVISGLTVLSVILLCKYGEATYVVEGAAPSLATTPIPGDEINYGHATHVRSRRAVLSKEEVISMYHKEFTCATKVDIKWTGSVDGCNAGTTSKEYQLATARRLNFYRALEGIEPITLSESEEQTQSCQEASLMFVASRELSHFPSQRYTCLTTKGRNAAGKSNINIGWSNSAAYFKDKTLLGPDSIDSYINDPGEGNEKVGHRAWFLYEGLKQISVGGAGPDKAASHDSVVEAGAIWVGRPNFIWYSHSVEKAYPAIDGYFPYQLLPESLRWSFAMAFADFTSASVSILLPNGETVYPTVEYRSKSEGLTLPEPSLNFLVNVPPRISSVGKYVVTVSNYYSYEQKEYLTKQYTVEVINPGVHNISPCGETLASGTFSPASECRKATNGADIGSAVKSKAHRGTIPLLHAGKIIRQSCGGSSTGYVALTWVAPHAGTYKFKGIGKNGLSSSEIVLSIQKASELGPSCAMKEVVCGIRKTEMVVRKGELLIIAVSGVGNSHGDFVLSVVNQPTYSPATSTCPGTILAHLGQKSGRALYKGQLVAIRQQPANIPQCAATIATTATTVAWIAPATGKFRFKARSDLPEELVVTVNHCSGQSHEELCGERKVTTHVVKGREYSITIQGQTPWTTSFELDVRRRE